MCTSKCRSRCLTKKTKKRVEIQFSSLYCVVLVVVAASLLPVPPQVSLANSLPLSSSIELEFAFYLRRRNKDLARVLRVVGAHLFEQQFRLNRIKRVSIVHRGERRVKSVFLFSTYTCSLVFIIIFDRCSDVSVAVVAKKSLPNEESSEIGPILVSVVVVAL